MEGLRMFLIIIVTLVIGFIVYPIGMEMFGQFSGSIISDNSVDPLTKLFFVSFPVIMAFGIVLFAIFGGRR